MSTLTINYYRKNCYIITSSKFLISNILFIVQVKTFASYKQRSFLSKGFGIISFLVSFPSNLILFKSQFKSLLQKRIGILAILIILSEKIFMVRTKISFSHVFFPPCTFGFSFFLYSRLNNCLTFAKVAFLVEATS